MAAMAAPMLLLCVLGVFGAKQIGDHSDINEHPAQSVSILQTQKQTAIATLKASCNDTELVCPYLSWLPFGYACAPRHVGCPVSCSSGEHVCHTPSTCETCAAVNYCSSQPCPMVCGFGQTICCDLSDNSLSCVDLDAGCPINCTEGAFSCHAPPSCAGCAGVNWCSSSPCPANCDASETSCSTTNSTFCVPFEQGCPANCSEQEYSCHSPGRVTGEAGVNWCSSTPCSPICNTSEVACALTNGSEVCVGREQGCPVSCAKHEHQCYAPPTCKNCTGLNWCSSDPCPQMCASHEISCSRHNGTNFCVKRKDGCPAKCSKEEHACHWPPHPPSKQAFNWCSTKKCPKACGATELACAEDDGSGSCVPRAEGCPVKCKKHEHQCHSPPAHADGSGRNWCSDVPCPANCSKGQVACLGADEAYTCHNRTAGCPANCSKRQHVCHSAPKDECPDCVAVNWCSEEQCPEACAADEITCPPHKGSGAFCRRLSQGCPVHCKASEHSCHAPPHCAGCMGSNWCSDKPCPLLCAADEMECVGSNGTEFCVLVSEGCPVSCRDEDYICHMSPQCAECVGTNWCSPTPCATSV
ncbi:ndor1 [Symbiodinium natans]|uniref:Ndor1 protein n=1 Tax=Symbiodinium natans TaxID=878477 RepID=A0A812NEX1_9DINO|nr:ndor1 [Symbiodinium natans]